MSEKHPPVAQQVAELIQECAREWMRYAEMSDGTRVRATWHSDAEGETLHIENENAGISWRFKIDVTAIQLPPLPPVGPENDLGVYGIDEREEAADWVPRTWQDVRPGDTVRLPGAGDTAHVLTVLPVQHLTNGANYQPRAQRWQSITVTLAGDTAPAHPLKMDPAGAVEILLSPGEAAAIEALGGWSERVRMEQS